jgi:hypothetical protein
MRVVLFIILFQFFNIGLKAQDQNQSLIDAVALFHSGVGNTDPNVLVANFEKLAQTPNMPNAWMPPYYLSLLYSRLSLLTKSSADAYADKAIYWANASISINANDENFCALSMARTAKMAVNPYLRWVTYEKSIYAPLRSAKKANPNNPRIYILEGSLTLNMPSLFGGGCEKARPILSKAKELLAKQTPQKLLPTWGDQHLEALRKNCVF